MSRGNCRRPVWLSPPTSAGGRPLLECGRRPHALRRRFRSGAELIKRKRSLRPRRAMPGRILARFLYVAPSAARPYCTGVTEHHAQPSVIVPRDRTLLQTAWVPDNASTRPITSARTFPSENILVAFHNPSALRVYRINMILRQGDEVTHRARRRRLFAHQGAHPNRQPAGDPGERPRNEVHADQVGGSAP